VIQSSYKNFQRSNPVLDLALEQNNVENYDNSFVHLIESDKLDYSLKAIVPRLTEQSSDVLYFILSNGNEQSKRYYLHRFWYNIYPDAPYVSYTKYMEIANAVDLSFRSGFGFGFETDRGRTFLKYGKPNDIIAVEDEPSAPPYEIWFYNELPETEQTNVKFLFYNPSLGNNDYTLLHSTCRGEVSNPAWEVELYRKAPGEAIGNSIDARNVQDNYNRNARRYFENN
jgi:GWxTD domain-containing protein